MLTPRDDFRHTLVGPLARESQFLSVPLAAEGLNIHLYWWVDGAGMAGRVVGLFSNDNHRLLLDRKDGIAMGQCDFDDWRIAGLEIAHRDALEVADYRYADSSFALDLRFEAMHRAFAYSENADGCPPSMAAARFEQSGRVQGHLTLAGRRMEIDTWGHRDHSWGQRDYAAMHHFKWVSTGSVDGTALNGFQLLAAGEQTINGYLFRDGVLAPLVTFENRVEYNTILAPLALESRLTDSLGRVALGSAQRFSHLRWEALPIVMDDIGCRTEVDGVPGAAHIGFAWTRAYLDQRLGALA